MVLWENEIISPTVVGDSIRVADFFSSISFVVHHRKGRPLWQQGGKKGIIFHLFISIIIGAVVVLGVGAASVGESTWFL